jgi:ubiquinone biosynthesis monooxygenase Coq7
LTGELPGDPSAKETTDRMIRVDHAGEYGATRIYAGQLAVLGRGGKGDLIRHMQAQEQNHLRTFDAMIVDRRVRPTAMLPFWHLAGYALGAVTAALGEKAAMACTVAVEEVIDDHYANQLETLGRLESHGTTEAQLQQTVEAFRGEELEHRETALEHGAELASGYRLLSRVIKAGCRAAIVISERI